MKEPSRFLPFLPDFPLFSRFFPSFSLFSRFVGNFFAIRRGTLPPPPPIGYATDSKERFEPGDLSQFGFVCDQTLINGNVELANYEDAYDDNVML